MKNNLLTHQMKSRWYYIFWAIMTAAVVSGQLYVGTSYKAMSNSIEKLINNAVVIK
tara:strand:- start:590 stop:757 length:168 start_codon:yes stop_codon:yes gene_type:complete